MGIVQEHEIYLNDDRLCFLFSLLQNNGAKVSCTKKRIADNFKNNFEVFVSEVFETYIQTLPKHKQEQIIDELSDYDDERIPYKYNDWYSITYSRKRNELSITLKENGLLLDDTLRRYAQNYWEDDLFSWNETNHYCSEKICRDFYQEILDYNCKNYYVEDTKNIHAIVLGYYKGYIEVNNIECDIDLTGIGDMTFQPCARYQTNAITHFKCCINANRFKKEFEDLIKGQHSKCSTSKVVNKIQEYPKQQKKMYDSIVNWIENMGSYNFPPDELRNILNIGFKNEDTDILNNAVSLLNKCYKEIENSSKPLIKKNRRTGYYEISKDFKIQVN